MGRVRLTTTLSESHSTTPTTYNPPPKPPNKPPNRPTAMKVICTDWKSSRTVMDADWKTPRNVMDANFRRADARGVHTRFTDPVSDSNKLQRQNAVADFIPGPANGAHWSERVMRMIEDSLPEGCYLKTMKGGHINIMMDKKNVALRIDRRDDGAYMSSWDLQKAELDGTKKEKHAYLLTVDDLKKVIEGDITDWEIGKKGFEGARCHAVKSRTLKLTGLTCKKITEEVSKFLTPRTATWWTGWRE
jgi:hypothetical protein